MKIRNIRTHNTVQFYAVAAVGSLIPLRPAIVAAARKILMNKNSPGDKQRMQNATVKKSSRHEIAIKWKLFIFIQSSVMNITSQRRIVYLTK